MFSYRSKRDKGTKGANIDYTKVLLQKNYVLEEVLGQGTNAKVHKATRKKKKGKVVAVKIMKTKEEIEKENGLTGGLDDEKLFRHEIDVMMKIKERLPDHEHIMQLISVCMCDDPTAPPARPCLVLEYLPGGELFDKIVQKKYFTESDAASIFKKLISTIRDLHGAGIVHRDLKPENIIYGNSEEVIKIADFGTAKIMGDDEVDIYADYKIGSPGYFAPETIYKNYHPANDIWSMGCILYTLLVGYMAFDMDDPMLIVKLMTCRFEFHEEAWKNISPEAKDLISKMISKPYKERITAEEILKHSWFVKMARRPSQANLGETLIRLKELNDEKEKKKQLMREYFFNNVLSVRSKVTEIISTRTRQGVTALKKIRSRGMSAFSQKDMENHSNSYRSKSKRNKKVITLNHTKPKNRQEMLSDIRNKHGHIATDDDDDEDSDDEDVSRDRSKSTMAAIGRGMLNSISRRKKKKKKKEPKNIQAMLSDIRTRNSVMLRENQVQVGAGGFYSVDIKAVAEKDDKIEKML